MKPTKKTASFFILAFFWLYLPLFAQPAVYDGKNKLTLSDFLVLESSLEKGRWLAMDAQTAGVQKYTGGALPAALGSGQKMYTFKTSFAVAESSISSDLSLFMGLTEYPYSIYLNGSEIFKKGRYQGPRYNSSMRAVHEVFLPPSLLASSGFNTLVLEIYPRTETCALDIMYVDSTESVSRAVFLRNFVGTNLIQGAFVMSCIIGIYFLILFVAEKKRQKNHLIFAFFCFSFFFATMAIATHHDTSNEVLMENFSKFGLLLSSTFILRFFMEFTGVFNKSRILRYALYAFGLIVSVIALLQPNKESLTIWFSVAIFALVVPAMCGSVAVLLIAIFKNRQKKAIVLLLSFVIMVAAVLHDVSFLSTNSLPYAWLTTYGYFAIVLAIFALLAQDQASLYHESLQNAADLIIDRSRIETLNEELTKQKDSFFRFVPTQFLQLLGRDSAVDIQLGDSSLRYLTILFSDIRRFTSIAEGMLPIEIFEFLNSYLLRMEKVVQTNAGFVDKYIGDGVMALYSSDRHQGSAGNSSCADNALRSALDIKRELLDFNESIAKRDMPPIQIGIGINTGEVTLGTVGSNTRLDTTVIGDAVNLASRLESLTKFYRTQNLVSEHTVNSLLKPGDFSLRMIDFVSVAGRNRPVKIFELLQPGIVLDDRKSETMDSLDEAMSLYLAQDFEEAFIRFSKLQKLNAHDNIPGIFVDRCAAYMNHRPEKTWDGVFRISDKDIALN